MDRVWRNEQAIDSVVSEQSKALERERILAEEVNFLKDEVDRLELVLRKDNLKFLGIPETAQESYEACVQKVVDVLNDAGELTIPFTAADIQQAYRINGRRRRNDPPPPPPRLSSSLTGVTNWEYWWTKRYEIISATTECE